MRPTHGYTRCTVETATPTTKHDGDRRTRTLQSLTCLLESTTIPRFPDAAVRFIALACIGSFGIAVPMCGSCAFHSFGCRSSELSAMPMTLHTCATGYTRSCTQADTQHATHATSQRGHHFAKAERSAA
jgi:hypothetical protein